MKRLLYALALIATPALAQSVYLDVDPKALLSSITFSKLHTYEGQRAFYVRLTRPAYDACYPSFTGNDLSRCVTNTRRETFDREIAELGFVNYLAIYGY